MFRREDRERVANGEITVTYRLWKTAKVKAGTTYRTPLGTIEIQDVQVLPAGMIAKRDVRRTGCPDIPSVWVLAGEHTHTIVGPDTLLHRIQFRFLGDVAPATAPSRSLEVHELAVRLAKMDQRSPRGAWTYEVLRTISEQPRVPARLLAAELDWERLDFKAHVRKLKALGLTISHEVGYELSALGERYLAAGRRSNSRTNPKPHNPLRQAERVGRRPG